MTQNDDIAAALYAAIQTRPRPEDVAELVIEALGDRLDAGEHAALYAAARHSLKRMGHRWSSMAADFARPVPMTSQVATASALFEVPQLSSADCLDPVSLDAFIEQVSAVIARARGEVRRMTKAQRRAAGIFKGHRWYNKRWRLCGRMEDRVRRLARETRKYTFTRIGKGGLAFTVPKGDVMADTNTACFVAYMTARMGVRSVFTNESQQQVFDHIAAMLLDRCEREADRTRWDVIATVMPDARVLGHLSDEQKGALLGRWWNVLVDAADLLRDTARENTFDLDRMVVSRGNDSSTWNQVAGGWNKARAHWVSLAHALGMDSLLDAACPGKVLRLMAADVVSWHLSSGGGVHPDTKVWARLPRPWDVVHGEAACPRALVEVACDEAGVDRQTWTGAMADRTSVPFVPTPELVHGIAVSSPDLARALRKSGAFSAQFAREYEGPDFAVPRDRDGFALGATDVVESTGAQR
jgi:hypothetical protein